MIYQKFNPGERWEMLRPDYSELKQYRIVTFDTEDNSEGLFTCGSIVDDTGKYIYFSRDDMKEKLLSYRGQEYRIFAHNLMYDIVNVFQPEYESMSVFFIQGRAITLKYVYGDRKKDCLIFQDSFNLFPGSLKAIGKITGEQKEDISTDILIQGIENNEEIIAQIAKYCCQDSYSLFVFLNQFQDRLNAKNTEMKSTIGATSLNQFRRNYQDRNFKKMTSETLEQFTHAYYGGRVECYAICEQNEYIPGLFHYMDINSAYPFAMLKDLPNPNTCHYTESGSLDIIEKYQGISFVDIYAPEMKYPVLPVRIGLSIYYPIGTLTGSWTHEEILYAVSCGYEIRKVFFTYYFTESEKFLEQFVIDNYREKSENTGLLREIAKLFLNNLYGKFSQVNTLDEYMTLDQYLKSPYYKTHTAQVLHDNWVRIFDDTRNFPAHSNVIWSAYITSYQRTYLHRYLEKYSALYCDTDSIISFFPFDAADCHATEIGKWKHEKSTEKLGIYSPKCYIFGETIHAKGVRRDMQEEALTTGQATYQKPLKFKEAIRRGKQGNLWEEQTKKLELNYTKRKIMWDFDAGFHMTEPFNIQEVKK